MSLVGFRWVLSLPCSNQWNQLWRGAALLLAAHGTRSICMAEGLDGQVARLPREKPTVDRKHFGQIGYPQKHQKTISFAGHTPPLSQCPVPQDWCSGWAMGCLQQRVEPRVVPGSWTGRTPNRSHKDGLRWPKNEVRFRFRSNFDDKITVDQRVSSNKKF